MFKEKKLERFEIIEKIGEGIYGTVFKVQDKKSKEFFALKRIKMNDETQGVPATTIREISILKDLDHKNIVKLHNIIHWNKNLYLLFELADMDLNDLTQSKKKLSLKNIKIIIYQLLKAVECLILYQIMHRDIKPQNILVYKFEKSIGIKLADFGLARSCSLPAEKYTKDAVTLWYRAPELLFGFDKYSYGVDIWSVGCIMAELLFGKPFFPGKNEEDQIFCIFKKMGYPKGDDLKVIKKFPGFFEIELFEEFQGGSFEKFFPKLDSDGINLLTNMLELNYQKRWSIEDLLGHSWFLDIDKEVDLIFPHT